MDRLNSYLLCADTKPALIFLAKASICRIFQQSGSSFFTDCIFDYTRFDQCMYNYKISCLCAQVDSNIVTHPNFVRVPDLLKSGMVAIGWRATLYSMLYVRHPLWVRLLTIQPLCVPGTCRGFSFMSELFHVRFTYLNSGILELLWTIVRAIEITDFTTTKFLMPCKENYLLQLCNLFLIRMYLSMENLILCSFKKKNQNHVTWYLISKSWLPQSYYKVSQYIPAIASIWFSENVQNSLKKDNVEKWNNDGKGPMDTWKNVFFLLSPSHAHWLL